jgi:hypothetical protein
MEDLPDYVDILAASRMEWEILQLLLLSNDDKPIWTIEEVLDQTADPVVALDALSMLSEVGLVRRRGDFVVITVAAMCFHQLSTDPGRAEWIRPKG